MRCPKCKRSDTILVKLIQEREDPVWVCRDDRTCEAIAEKRRKKVSPKMAKVRELAERFAS